MREFEKWVARVLLLNSVLTFGVVFGFLGEPQQPGDLAMLVTAAGLGAIAGALSLRGRMLGLWGGLLYYGLQLFSYYPSAPGWSFSVKAGLSIAAVLHLHAGVLVINFVALALMGATVAVLLWRRRRDRRQELDRSSHSVS